MTSRTGGAPVLHRIIETGAVCALFAAAIAVIHPHGNFPLNDDGLYALPTFEFAATGRFHMTMMSPSLRAQIVWGALWVRAFGATYMTLRLCSIATAIATVAMVNVLLPSRRSPAPLASWPCWPSHFIRSFSGRVARS